MVATVAALACASYIFLAERCQKGCESWLDEGFAAPPVIYAFYAATAQQALRDVQRNCGSKVATINVWEGHGKDSWKGFASPPAP